MNLDKISFRPALGQKEYLKELAGKYGVDNTTELMRKLVDDSRRPKVADNGSISKEWHGGNRAKPNIARKDATGDRYSADVDGRHVCRSKDGEDKEPQTTTRQLETPSWVEHQLKLLRWADQIEQQRIAYFSQVCEASFAFPRPVLPFFVPCSGNTSGYKSPGPMETFTESIEKAKRLRNALEDFKR